MITQNFKTTIKINLLKSLIQICIAVVLAITLVNPAANAQTFDSTSDGSDGALDFSDAEPGSIIIFEPTSFDPPLDPDGDNVYHFTTITIPEDVTVRLIAGNTSLGSRSVYWLASGAVQIDGTIDLNGEDGHSLSGPFIPAMAGAGGYNGGIGGTSLSSPQAGSGPGGGQPQSGYHGGGGGHASRGGGGGVGGPAYGNNFLLPLLGGSGGAGGAYYNGPGSGGGAGGGALLIASSASITVNGTITANGGNGGSPTCYYGGGGGSGGAIRLVATTISGTGTLSANGGTAPSWSYYGSSGRIRMEAFQHAFTGAIRPSPTVATPGIPFLPAANQPMVRVVSVASVPVPENPTASFLNPDVTINEALAVTLTIEAHFIPPGAVVQLTIFSETGPLQIVDSTPLAGTLENSTATASVEIPAGLSRVSVMATWEP